MSVDTTVVILGRSNAQTGDREYTACVVQNVEDLYEGGLDALDRASRILSNRHPDLFFSKLSRAKQFARLLQEEAREYGWLEYDGLPIFLVTDDDVHRLTQKGGLMGKA